MRAAVPAMAALLVAGCAFIEPHMHNAAPDPAHPPSRILVLNGLQPGPNGALPDGFAARMTALLASCGIVARVVPFNDITLNPAQLLAVANLDFKPDARLSIGRTAGPSMSAQPSGLYVVNLRSSVTQRDLWRGTYTLGFGSLAGTANYRTTGENLANGVVRTMSADRVLPNCPPIPPDAA